MDAKSLSNIKICHKNIEIQVGMKLDISFIGPYGSYGQRILPSYSHLGHVVTDSLDDGPDISKRQGDFIRHVNSVLCDFRQLPSIVKYRLFSSYCTSFYGSELCGTCQMLS